MRKILNFTIFITIIVTLVALIVHYGLNGSIFNSSSISQTDSKTSTSERIEVNFINDVILDRSDVESDKNNWNSLIDVKDRRFHFEVIQIINDYHNSAYPECETIMKKSVNELMKKSLYEFKQTISFSDLFYLTGVEHGDNSTLEYWQGALQSEDATAGMNNDIAINFTMSGELYDITNNLVKSFQNVSFGFRLFIKCHKGV